VFDKLTDELNTELEREFPGARLQVNTHASHRLEVHRDPSRLSMSSALARAVAGLHEIEMSLAELQEQLVGPIMEKSPECPLVEELPLFDQVRKQVASLAQLGLVMNRRIKAIREGL
jgi:hypothetical protein